MRQKIYQSPQIKVVAFKVEVGNTFESELKNNAKGFVLNDSEGNATNRNNDYTYNDWNVSFGN